MKSIYLLTCFLLLSLLAKALTNFPVAVSSNGVFVGKYKKTEDTLNALPDSISFEDARTIFAINVLELENNLMPKEIRVTGFQMTTEFADEKFTFHTTGNRLSEEMKTHLQKIKPGTNLFFEDISTIYPDGTGSMVVLLHFIVF